MGDDPNPSVYQPFHSFTCGDYGCIVTTRHEVRPEREIAGGFLEELSDWLGALEREKAPERVLFALRAAHEAACWWTNELDKPRPPAPDGPTPRRAG